MTKYHPVTSRKVLMGKLRHGCDLLEELTRVSVECSIRLGRIQAIGAVQNANLGYYNQQAREYRYVALDQPLEITTLWGNISLKDGNPFVHVHVTLSDADGKAYGGHLAPGTMVFACEFILEAYRGPDYHRTFDQETGLPLWAI